jgi:hypothetical protein
MYPTKGGKGVSSGVSKSICWCLYFLGITTAQGQSPQNAALTQTMILCITDSIAMPRDGVEYEDTWIARLRQHRYPESVVAHSQRAATTHKLHTHVLYHYRPDTVVTQLGIVDCAPRYFRNAERWILRAVPHRAKSTYMSLLKRLRTRRSSRRKVSVKQFRTNVSQFYRAASSEGIDIITIAIAPPTSQFVSKSPYID